MQQYQDLCIDILQNGEKRDDRTGTGTLSVFGRQLRFDLSEGFPAITTKKLFIKGVWVELLWMLSGDSSAKYMLENNVHIWDEWLKEDNDLGPVYGVQWRRWKKHHFKPIEYVNGNFTGLQWKGYVYVDQLQNTIDSIRNNPSDRRMLVSAWNPGELNEMALPPCHYSYQFYVHNDGRLDILVNQRSADVFLGLPFDIASYATLLCMVAHVTGKRPGEVIYNLGDTHIYLNHIDKIVFQLSRKPRQLPSINVNRHNRVIKEIDDFVLDDLQIVDYDPYPAIKGEVSV